MTENQPELIFVDAEGSVADAAPEADGEPKGPRAYVSAAADDVLDVVAALASVEPPAG